MGLLLEGNVADEPGEPTAIIDTLDMSVLAAAFGSNVGEGEIRSPGELRPYRRH